MNYPKDLSLVENADLIIISSDGGQNTPSRTKKIRPSTPNTSTVS